MWVPPDFAVRLADERTGGMLMFYVMNRLRIPDVNGDGLAMLVRSAYLQGVNDTAEAMAKQGLILGAKIPLQSV